MLLPSGSIRSQLYFRWLLLSFLLAAEIPPEGGKELEMSWNISDPILNCIVFVWLSTKGSKNGLVTNEIFPASIQYHEVLSSQNYRADGKGNPRINRVASRNSWYPTAIYKAELFKRTVEIKDSSQQDTLLKNMKCEN